LNLDFTKSIIDFIISIVNQFFGLSQNSSTIPIYSSTDNTLTTDIPEVTLNIPKTGTPTVADEPKITVDTTPKATAVAKATAAPKATAVTKVTTAPKVTATPKSNCCSKSYSRTGSNNSSCPCSK
jgi:hypothetical protein